jgi:hypothetical protein
VVHVRTIEDRVLDFGVSGSLWKDAMVMYDRQTQSFWSQITGESIEGELKGTRLEMIPSVVMAFAEWTRLYPETLVLTKHPGDPDASRYEDYVNSSRQGIFGTQAKRDELAPKAVVQGVAVGGQAAALPHASLREGDPVAFELDGEALAAVKAGSAVLIYRREVDGELLDLESTESQRLRDRETGTVWDAATGQGVSGPLAEKALEPVPSTPVYWFAWLNFYPRAEVIR